LVLSVARLARKGSSRCPTNYRVTTDSLKEFLGTQKFRYELAEETEEQVLPRDLHGLKPVEISYLLKLCWCQARGISS
jgi:hypothetical protein